MTDSESVWCLTLHVRHETVYWRNTRWLTRSQCDVWHFMSLTRRYIEVKEYSVLFAIKPNTQEFPFCVIKDYWSVLGYPTLAINLSLLQRSHLKPDTLNQKDGFYGRKADSYSPVSSKSARSRHYFLAKPARLRHYHLASDHKWNERSTDISLLISIHTIHLAFKRALSKKMNVLMTFVFRRWSGQQLRPSKGGRWHAAGRFPL